jgi:excisionase family DNA binding protein
MKTLHVDSTTEEASVAEIHQTLHEMIGRGLAVSVTIFEEGEKLSPQQASQRLGFSRQHVMRLIDAGELEAEQMPGSSYWKVPLASILDFEERRDRANQQADEFSRSLDEVGAPLE